jgi:hypothetical protein
VRILRLSHCVAAPIRRWIGYTAVDPKAVRLVGQNDLPQVFVEFEHAAAAVAVRALKRVRGGDAADQLRRFVVVHG